MESVAPRQMRSTLMLLVVASTVPVRATDVADGAAHFVAHNHSLDARVGLRWLAQQSPRYPFWMAVPYKSRAAWQAWQPNEMIWERGKFHDEKEARLARAIFYAHCPTRPQRLVVDVGSNTGFFALLAAASGCRSVAFEGAPLIADVLKISRDVNGFRDRFTIINRIVSHERQVGWNGWNAVAASDVKQFEASAISKSKPNAKRDGSPMKMVDAGGAVAISDVVSSDVLYLKMDVEGHEPSAYESARRVLDAHTVFYLLFEVTYYAAPQFTHDSYRPMLTDLLRRGYRLYHLQAMEPDQFPRRGAITSAGCSRKSSGEKQTATCKAELDAWLDIRMKKCKASIHKVHAISCQLDIFATHPVAKWPVRG